MHKGFKVASFLGFLAAIGLGIMGIIADNAERYGHSVMGVRDSLVFIRVALITAVSALLVLVVGWLFDRFLKTVPQRLFFLWIIGTLLLGTVFYRSPDIFSSYLPVGGYLLLAGASLRAVWLMLNSSFGDALEQSLRIAVFGCALSGAGSWVSLAALVVIIVWIPVRRFYFEPRVSPTTEN